MSQYLSTRTTSRDRPIAIDRNTRSTKPEGGALINPRLGRWSPAPNPQLVYGPLAHGLLGGAMSERTTFDDEMRRIDEIMADAVTVAGPSPETV
jgi:hypothetical protein